MDREIIDFLYIYSLGRKNEDINYVLDIEQIDEAVFKAGAEKEALTKWLNKNT